MAVMVGLLGFNNLLSPVGLPSPVGETLSEIMNLCVEHNVNLITRMYPHIRIVIDGKEEPIPANIGVEENCMRPVHTYDETGTIHVEAAKTVNIPLGEFFRLWKKEFSRNQILDHVRDAEHEIVMFVDGKPSEAFGDLVMRDRQEILIEYRKIVQNKIN
jgi:hypothetical protein